MAIFLTTNTAKQITKVNYEEYSVENHLKNKSKQTKELFSALRKNICFRVRKKD